jgi:hypothetical protein
LGFFCLTWWLEPVWGVRDVYHGIVVLL